MLFLAFILMLHLIIGLVNENLQDKIVATFFNLILILLSLFLTIGITYNSDWNMYYYLFKLEHFKTDFMFTLLTKIFKGFGLTYEELFIFHIISIIFLFFFLITRFTRNYVYVFLIYFLLDYVHFTNQIRYYIGFPIMIMGLYYLLHKKNYILGICLATLSILFHNGLVVLFLFIPSFLLINEKKYLKVLMFCSFIFATFLFLVLQYGIGISFSHFDNYLGGDYETSLIGGLFNALPYIIYLSFLIIEYSRITRKYPEIIYDRELLFLTKISFFPVLFLLTSFFLQIVGHRYILPFSIFWIIFYLKLISGLSQKVRLFKMILFSLVHLITLVCIYILPDFFLSENHMKEELHLILESIPYLKDVIY